VNAVGASRASLPGARSPRGAGDAGCGGAGAPRSRPCCSRQCDAGEQCAVRKGARIGKLCDCPRATSCNSFLLKCL
uniref:Cocaine- and amphetamine-regulated transcript protein n=1 Tax=Apteryx owenii TaxID=8824 RepID=A0A8B9PN38_APTOW